MTPEAQLPPHSPEAEQGETAQVNSFADCGRCKKHKPLFKMHLVELQSGTPRYMCSECFYLIKDKLKARPGWIYVIGHGHFWKVGYTSGHPSLRLKAMQTGNPHPLEILMSWMVNHKTIGERLAHKALIHLHYRGEWFKGSDREIRATLHPNIPIERNTK